MCNDFNVLTIRFNQLDYSSLPLKLTPVFYNINLLCDLESVVTHVSYRVLPIDDMDK